MAGASISFGWGAPSFAEQLPSLPAADADRADAISKAITLLSVHGIITESERDRAIRRATRSIECALRKATKSGQSHRLTETCAMPSPDAAQETEAEGQDAKGGLVHEGSVAEGHAPDLTEAGRLAIKDT